ncbi:protein EARLY FLOWERING 4-like [Impatiens glandulifera]|uniref:protein EARLY FLOWERING 4-like n=1 Tax=Impatiens glandulifera TaxID=253017 RepID=UPI001FB05759|nr:protein EARLY FLOWERING 4-like [Impatiens glandulifera]
MEGNHLIGHRRRHRQTNINEDHSTATATTSTTTANNGGRSFRRFRSIGGDEGGGGRRGEEGDIGHGDGSEVWGAFSEKFQQVQSFLDRNRFLIQQVNDNHQSKIQENLVKNVALIQEINSNISKVVSLYSDLSANFSNSFQQRNGNK